MVDVNKSFEISDDGLTIDGGVNLTSGTAVPTHTAPHGSFYWRKDTNEVYQNQDGATDWQLFVSGGGGYAVKFGSNNNSGSGKWLEIHRNITSDQVPMIIPNSINLTELSAAISSSGTVTFGVYKNGSLLDTLVLTAVTKETKTVSHSLVQDDEISVKVESGNGQNPVIHLIFA